MPSYWKGHCVPHHTLPAIRVKVRLPEQLLLSRPLHDNTNGHSLLGIRLKLRRLNPIAPSPGPNCNRRCRTISTSRLRRLYSKLTRNDSSSYATTTPIAPNSFRQIDGTCRFRLQKTGRYKIYFCSDSASPIITYITSRHTVFSIYGDPISITGPTCLRLCGSQ